MKMNYRRENKINVYLLGNFKKEERPEFLFTSENLLKEDRVTGVSNYNVISPSLDNFEIKEEIRKITESDVVYVYAEKIFNVNSLYLMSMAYIIGLKLIDAITKEEISPKSIIFNI